MTKEIRQGSARYLVDEIVVHCSATRPTWMKGFSLAAKVAEIRRWHIQDRKWRDIGYHWIIDRDGAVAPGRRETEIGAGVEGHNRGVIHVCLIGGHGSAATDRFAQHFTRAQDAELRRLIAQISARTPIRRVSGHNEWAARACPGFNVPAWLAS
jgi:N-acetyl-anhydromuramyl-L-alanine amidase AmpD